MTWNHGSMDVDCCAVDNIADPSGERTVAGENRTDGTYVLLAGQTDLTERGPWLVKEGAWERIEMTAPYPQINVMNGAEKGLWRITSAGVNWGTDDVTPERV